MINKKAQTTGNPGAAATAGSAAFSSGYNSPGATTGAAAHDAAGKGGNEKFTTINSYWDLFNNPDMPMTKREQGERQLAWAEFAREFQVYNNYFEPKYQQYFLTNVNKSFKQPFATPLTISGAIDLFRRESKGLLNQQAKSTASQLGIDISLPDDPIGGKGKGGKGWKYAELAGTFNYLLRRAIAQSNALKEKIDQIVEEDDPNKRILEAKLSSKNQYVGAMRRMIAQLGTIQSTYNIQDNDTVPDDLLRSVSGGGGRFGGPGGGGIGGGGMGTPGGGGLPGTAGGGGLTQAQTQSFKRYPFGLPSGVRDPSRSNDTDRLWVKPLMAAYALSGYQNLSAGPVAISKSRITSNSFDNMRLDFPDSDKYDQAAYLHELIRMLRQVNDIFEKDNEGDAALIDSQQKIYQELMSYLKKYATQVPDTTRTRKKPGETQPSTPDQGVEEQRAKSAETWKQKGIEDLDWLMKNKGFQSDQKNQTIYKYMPHLGKENAYAVVINTQNGEVLNYFPQAAPSEKFKPMGFLYDPNVWRQIKNI